MEGADLLSRLRGVPRAPRVLAALLAALAGVAALAAVTGTASAGFVATTSTGVSLRAAWFAYLASTVTAFAGNGQQATTGDNGPATAAAINFPSAIAVDASGNVYVCEGGGPNVRMITPGGTITSPIGSGSTGFSGDNGPADAARLDTPRGIAIAPNGDVYVSDTANNRVRKVSNGVITTVAGTGGSTYAGDGGPATAAQLNAPRGLAVGPDGSLYIADWGNHVVRRVDLSGTITTVAGSGAAGDSGDGAAATAAALQNPISVAVTAGALLVVDRGANRVRKVSAGVISTVAGTGSAGSGGTGGPATSAGLNAPSDVVLDAAGSLYVADSGNSRVVKVDPDGTLQVVAGTGTWGVSGDGGPAAGATFEFPRALAFSPVDGTLYVSDQNADLVRRLAP